MRLPTGIALCVMLLGFSTTANAEPLKIAYDSSFRPFTYTGTDNKAEGFHVDIVRALARAEGLEIELLPMPWARLVKTTDRDEVSASIPWRSKPERFTKYNMVGPFTETGSRTMLFQRKDMPVAWSDLSDLKGKTVGVVRGFAYSKAFEDAEGIKRAEAPSTESLILQLTAGRLDLIISDETVLLSEATALGITDKIERSGPPLEAVKRYIVVSKEQKALADRLQKAMDSFRSSDDFKAIAAKYLGTQ